MQQKVFNQALNEYSPVMIVSSLEVYLGPLHSIDLLVSFKVVNCGVGPPIGFIRAILIAPEGAAIHKGEWADVSFKCNEND